MKLRRLLATPIGWYGWRLTIPAMICRGGNDVGELRARFVGPVIDTGHNATEMAQFYATLLGWRIAEQGPKGWWAIIRSPDDSLKIEFAGSPDYRRPVWPGRPVEEWIDNPVPAHSPGDQQQMMMHLDIEVEDLEAAVATAIDAGGSEAPWQPPNRNRERIRIMLDPAGHPLCLFVHGE